MHKVQFPMQYYSFLLDLVACCPSAHCLSIQRISKHLLHSPGAPINATFYCTIWCIPTDRHQRTFSTWWPCQGPFLFFLQTQTSGKVTTYKEVPGAWCWTTCSFLSLTLKLFLTHPLGLDLTTSYSLCLPWSPNSDLPNSDLPFRSQLIWNFLQKDVPALPPSYEMRYSLCVAMVPCTV